MKNVVKFTKMQGLGNDFIILELKEFLKLDGASVDYRSIPVELIKGMCRSHFSIGADGLIVVNPNVEGADIGWYFFNSDGSVAQMCGNGIRCFARYVYDKNILNGKKEFSVETKAGIIIPQILENGMVKVNMSRPILDCKKIPVKLPYNLNQEIELWSKKFKLNLVSMGNPHCVIFSEENIENLAKDYGPDIENLDIFPEKTNVEFVKIVSRKEIDVWVWERSCGITLACGTGACASVVAGILNGLLDNCVKVNLPGGALTISWDGTKDNTDKDVFMTGPCEYSYEGSYFI